MSYVESAKQVKFNSKAKQTPSLTSIKLQEGGTLLRGGNRVHPEGVENGFYFEPAIVVGLNV